MQKLEIKNFKRIEIDNSDFGKMENYENTVVVSFENIVFRGEMKPKIWEIP